MLDFISLLLSVEPIHAFGETELGVFSSSAPDEFMQAFNAFCKDSEYKLSMHKLDSDTYITIDCGRADPADVEAVLSQCEV